MALTDRLNKKTQYTEKNHACCLGGNHPAQWDVCSAVRMIMDAGK